MIGKKIKYYRKVHNMTQSYLGKKLGFSEKSADVRIAQYESERRVPNSKLLEQIAKELNVDTSALTVPDVSSIDDTMQILYELERVYELTPVVYEINGEPSVVLKTTNKSLLKQIYYWYVLKCKREKYNMSQAEYDLMLANNN